MKRKSPISKKIILNYVEALLKNETTEVPAAVKEAIYKSPILRKKVLELYWGAQKIEKEWNSFSRKVPAKKRSLWSPLILSFSKIRFLDNFYRFLLVYKRLALGGAFFVVTLALGFYLHKEFRQSSGSNNLASIAPAASNARIAENECKNEHSHALQKTLSSQPPTQKTQIPHPFSEPEDLQFLEKNLLLSSNLRGQDANENYEFFFQPLDSSYAAGRVALSFSLFSAQNNQYCNEALEAEIFENQRQVQIFELSQPTNYIYTFQPELLPGRYRLLIYKKNGLSPICKPFTFSVK
jgi:hypothetical protein